MLHLLIALNPLQNGDFEAWSSISSTIPFAWQTVDIHSTDECAWDLDSSTVYRGKYSILITSISSESGYDCAVAQSRPVEENVQYNLQAAILDNDPDATARLQALCFDASGSIVDSSTIAGPTADQGSWQVIGGTYDVPGGCEFLDIQVQVDGIGEIYLDGTSMFEGPVSYEPLVESFNRVPPSEWIEEDVGVTRYGLIAYRRNKTSCPFGKDSIPDKKCLGIKIRQQDADSTVTGISYLITDTLDFFSPEPETLLFFYRTSNTNNPMPTDSVNIEISTDGGRRWERIWKWTGPASTTPTSDTIPLDEYNGQPYVLLRIAYYKWSNGSVKNNNYLNIDSMKVLNSHRGRINHVVNPGFETWLLEDRDMVPDEWKISISGEPASAIAQIRTIREDETTFSGNHALLVYYTTPQDPEIWQMMSNPFDSCAGHPASDIDSFAIHTSIRYIDLDSNGKGRLHLTWYYGSDSISDSSTGSTLDGADWQTLTMADTLPENSADSAKLAIRFYPQGSDPIYIYYGAYILLDSVSVQWYCFVDDVTPVDVAEIHPFHPVIDYIRQYGNRVQISLKKPAMVEIYRVSGRRITARMVSGKQWFILPAGMSIIRIGNFTKKVIVTGR